MGKLTQNIRELTGVILLENGIHPDAELSLLSFGMDFVTMQKQHVKASWKTPDRDITTTIYFDQAGPNVVQIPSGMGDLISVGVQVGRYIKGLALNTRATAKTPVQATLGLVTNDSQSNQWYWGGLYGVGAWGASGSMGLSSFGNGQDFGDYQIDYAAGRIYTSHRYPYKNIVLNFFTDCITPSDKTCLNPFFVASYKDFVMWKYHRSRGDLAMARTFKEDWMGSYEYQVVQQNKIDRTTIIKIMERNLGYRHGRV